MLLVSKVDIFALQSSSFIQLGLWRDLVEPWGSLRFPEICWICLVIEGVKFFSLVVFGEVHCSLVCTFVTRVNVDSYAFVSI